ncbi:MAG: hypothetical protein ACJ780_17550 [Solirubrobacteraceae bacterium]
MSGARRVNGQSYREWRDDFMAANGLTMPMDLATRRQMLYQACPNGFFPPFNDMHWQKFVEIDRGADQRSGQVYQTGAAPGKRDVDEYVQLAFEDFREVCVRRAALAAVDLEAVREMATIWADANPQTRLDVDRFMDDVKQAAGL